jgi:hypothetical protein
VRRAAPAAVVPPCASPVRMQMTATPSTHPKECCASGTCTWYASGSSAGREAGVSEEEEEAGGMAEKTGEGNRLIDRAETTRIEWYANMTCIQRSYWVEGWC